MWDDSSSSATCCLLRQHELPDRIVMLHVARLQLSLSPLETLLKFINLLHASPLSPWLYAPVLLLAFVLALFFKLHSSPILMLALSVYLWREIYISLELLFPTSKKPRSFPCSHNQFPLPPATPTAYLPQVRFSLQSGRQEPILVAWCCAPYLGLRKDMTNSCLSWTQLLEVILIHTIFARGANFWHRHISQFFSIIFA